MTKYTAHSTRECLRTVIFDVIGVCSVTCTEHVCHYLTFSCTLKSTRISDPRITKNESQYLTNY